MNALLKAENISKTFFNTSEPLTVLRNITCKIDTGEFLAITGKSGSGKSTLMHILGCLDEPTTGDYFIAGDNVAHLHSDERALIRNKMIGFVFQKFHLLEDETAINNVALPQLYANISEHEARKKAAYILGSLDLADRLHHYPNQLSGGEQQRVAIARALANDPSIILADEPTGNLDSKTGALIIDMFMRLNKEKNITVIIVTHDESLARQTNRIITLHDGEIIRDAKL